MIYIGGHRNIVGIYYNGKYLTAKYFGTHLVWQAVRSCFGSGQWLNDKPWINDEAWKNN